MLNLRQASLNYAQKKTPLIVVKDEASSGSAGDTDESFVQVLT